MCIAALVTAVAAGSLLVPSIAGAAPTSPTPPACGTGTVSSGSVLGDQSGNVAGSDGILASGQCLVSPDDQFELVMQADGNLVEYLSSEAEPVWSSGTAGNIGAYAVMQSDGNLVVEATGSGAAIWSAGSQAPDPTLSMQADGNVVVYGTNSAGPYAAWATNTVGYRGTTLLAGQTVQPGQYLQSANGQYKLQMSAAGVLALYSTQPYACPLWTAPTIASAAGYEATPQPGSYLEVDQQGGLDLYSSGTTNAWWTASQTGTWNGGGNASGDHLSLQTDGNLVLSTSGDQVTRWSSSTEILRGSIWCTGTDLHINQYLVAWTQGSTSSSAAPRYTSVLIMQTDCNLVLYNNHTAVWSSNTSTNTAGAKDSLLPDPAGQGNYNNCYAAMQGTGNLVVYAPTYPGGQRALWDSGTVASKAPPFNLGAIGPYLAVPIVLPAGALASKDTIQAPYVTTVHGETLGDPTAPSSSKTVLQILSYVLDGLALVLTFVGGPLGAVFDGVAGLSGALTGASLGVDAAGVGVSAGEGAQSNAITGQGPASLNAAPAPAACATGDPSSGSSLPTGLLTAGQCLVAPNGQYELLMQGDGNLVLYAQNGNALWSSNTAGNPGAFLRLQANGYMAVINNANVTQLWPTGNDFFQGTPNPNLVLQDDGNLVLYGYGTGGGVPYAAWSTGTNLTNILTCSNASPSALASGVLQSGACLLSPNHQYGLLMQANGNAVLYRAGDDYPLWAAFPQGSLQGAGGPVSGAVAGDTLVLYADGNLCVTGWCNGATAAKPTLALENNGNLVEYANNSTPSNTVSSYAAWQTGTANLQGNTLPTGSTLMPGQYLQSANGTYTLSMGTNGLLELSYVSDGYFCPMWSRPSSESGVGALADGDGETYSPSLVAGSSLTMQTDGNLVLNSSSGAAYVNVSNTPNSAGAYVQLGDDGNVVVYSAGGGSVLWQSGTNVDRGSALCTGGTLSGGQFLTVVGEPNETATDTLVMQGTCNLVYYTTHGYPFWSSKTDEGSAADPGGDDAGCYLTMQTDGNLVIYAPNYPGGQKALWSSGTHQSSIPPNLVENLGPFTLTNVGYTYNGEAAEIVYDSASVIWTSAPNTGLFKADGSTAVGAVQTLVGFLTFLLPLLL